MRFWDKVVPRILLCIPETDISVCCVAVISFSEKKKQTSPLQEALTPQAAVTWTVACAFAQVSAQSCPTLSDPVDCTSPGLPVHHQLPELAQTQVRRGGDAIQPSHPVVPFSSRLQSFPASGSFPMSRFFASGSQSIRVSVSTSVLPMNIQD